jgi:hypothetical protein
MKTYNLEYSWDSGRGGSFNRTYPEPHDLGMSWENPAHMSAYWAAFRQWNVTDRALVKRLQDKKENPWNKADAERHMETAPMPKYSEPTAQISTVTKAQVKEFQGLMAEAAQAGVDMETIKAMIAQAKAAQAGQ